MEVKDFFDLTGLPYDEDRELRMTSFSLARVIDKSLSALREEQDDGSTSASRKKELQTHIDLLTKSRGELLSASDNNIDRSLLRAMKQKRVRAESDKLRKWVQILRSSGRSSFTKGTINARRGLTGLSRQTIQSVFESEGLTLREIELKRPSFPLNAQRILADMQRLHDLTVRLRPNNPVLPNAYSCIAYLAEFTGDASKGNEDYYRSLSAQDLCAKLRTFASHAKLTKAGVDDELGNLCKVLANALETQILDTEEHRAEFDVYVLYCGQDMTELFAHLKQATPSELREPGLAEAFLRQMRGLFHTGLGRYLEESVLLSMYNTQAGLIDDDPYYPEKVVIYVSCPLHGCVSEFESMQEAYTINTCKVCGAPLFKECAACHHMVSFSAITCPLCGTAFPDKALAHKHFPRPRELCNKTTLLLRKHLLTQGLSRTLNKAAKRSICATVCKS